MDKNKCMKKLRKGRERRRRNEGKREMAKGEEIQGNLAQAGSLQCAGPALPSPPDCTCSPAQLQRLAGDGLETGALLKHGEV